jgi:hypothetical protein
VVYGLSPQSSCILSESSPLEDVKPLGRETLMNASFFFLLALVSGEQVLPAERAKTVKG